MTSNKPIRVLVAGKQGQVARSLMDVGRPGFHVTAVGRPEIDIRDADSVARAVQTARPDVVVNAAAYTAVDKAETDADAARLVNETGARNVAEAAAASGVPVVHISTDYVFPGNKATPYFETDECGPLGVYGRTKLAGEKAVAEATADHVIFRTAWVYSEYGANFLKTMLRLAADRPSIRVVGDQRGSPTYAHDLSAGILAACQHLISNPGRTDWRGTFHLVSEGVASWAEFAAEIFRQSHEAGGPSAQVEAITTDQYPTPAARPQFSVLDTTRFNTVFQHRMPAWQDGVGRCLAALSRQNGN